MKKDIQILLVDDHQVVREGLRHMLGREENMEVVGEAADAKEALTQVELLSPNVILMDIKMPGMDGIELTRQVKQKQPSCNVIMLTLYDEYLAEAMEAGAGGYLLKDTKCAELAQVIRQVHQGEIVISESITSKPRIEYEERRGTKGQEGSNNIFEEVQLVIPPPVDANRLIGFVNRVEEIFQSRTLQMIGSREGSTAITTLLPKPTPLANILSKLEEMSEVETIGEEPLTGKGDLSLLKKAAAIPRLKIRGRKTIFITLKNGETK